VRIQNTNLAGERLTLRFATDDDGERIQLEGDKDGIFEMPEKDAEALLRTKGWRRVEERVARGLDVAPPQNLVPKEQPQHRVKPPLAPPMPLGALRAPTLPAPAPLKETVLHGPGGPGVEPEEPKSEEDEDEEPSDSDAEDDEETQDGPDLDKIRTKEQALELAKEWGIDTLNKDMKLSEMKAILDSELYGDKAKVPGPAAEEPTKA
jgi:hypothetical protein